MRLFSIDTETALIARGRQIPPLACLTWAELDLGSLGRQPRILGKGILDRHAWRGFLLPLLDDPAVHFCGGNIGFDVLVTSARWPNPDPDGPSYDEDVLRRWVAAFDADRVTDLLTRQKLLDLAAGCYRREQLPDGRWAHHRYNLESLAWRLCRMRLDKGEPQRGKAASTKLTVEEQTAAQLDAAEAQNTAWRLRYAELMDVPIANWPEEATRYAIDDAVAGALIWHEQESGRPVRHRNVTASTLAQPSDRLGYNIFSGSTDGNGLAAALTNQTELARRKGTLSQGYPVEFRGKTWVDAEAAWFALSLGLDERTADDLMAELIAAKFSQYSRLAQAVARLGGAAWLRRCSHFTGAQSKHMQAWEGHGEQSRFIRNLVAGYLRVAPQATPQALAAQPAASGHPPGLLSASSRQVVGQVGPASAIWAKVRENFGDDADPFADQYRQARGALWLRAMSAHGLRTDAAAVERFSEWVEGKHVEVRDRLVAAGLMRVEYHLDREKLAAWVVEHCRYLNVTLGTKKADLLKLAVMLGKADPDARTATLAACWLQIARLVRSSPEPQTLEASTRDGALEDFAALESAGLAYREYHRDTKAAARAMIAACGRADVTVPRTDTYDPCKHTHDECVALDKESVQSVRDGDLDGALADYAEISHLGKMLSADIPVLTSGTTAPIHTRFEELLETGRTGSSNPNVQNVARGEKCMQCRGKKQSPPCARCLGTGAELGARECFVPRELMWDEATQTLQPADLVDSDYNLGELHTLAQSCLWTFGWSKLADVLRAGRDPHTVVACRILGITYEEGLALKKIKDAAFDNARNSGKAVNFGKPGGLSAKTMRAYAVRSYGVDLPEERWVEILAMWDAEWQEMPHYFRWIDAMKGKRGRATVDKVGHRKIEQLYNLAQPWSGRLRAGCTYCSACNSVYQGLLSDVLKRAGWYLFKACYLRGAMPGAEALYGCRPVNEIHDQFLIEAPAVRGDAAARATGLLMNRAGAEICADVPVRCDPILAKRWSKRAEERRGGDGSLVAWEDARLSRVAR